MKAEELLVRRLNSGNISESDWYHVLEQALLRVTGESMAPPERIPCGYRFVNTRHALCEYAGKITDGASVPPTMDPDKMLHASAGWGTRSRSNFPGVAISQAEDLISVERALDYAFETLPEGRKWLDGNDCRAVVVINAISEATPTDLAQSISELTGWLVTPSEVATVLRWGGIRIFEHLFEAGMIPKPLPRTESMEANMLGNDLHGIKEIMSYWRVSETTVKRRIRDGMPHMRINNRVHAKRAEIDQWMVNSEMVEICG